MYELSIEQIRKIAKCSYTTAAHIRYNGICDGSKIYLSRGNNAGVTINWLRKQFCAVFERGNDAPRGGKHGDYVIVRFIQPAQINNLVQELNKANNLVLKANEEAKNKKAQALSSLTITGKDVAEFKNKTKHLSAKQTLQKAYNFTGRKLGFYSREAAQQLIKQTYGA